MCSAHRMSVVNPLVAHDYMGAGLEMRPFQPRILFTSYLLYPQHRPRSRPHFICAAFGQRQTIDPLRHHGTQLLG